MSKKSRRSQRRSQGPRLTAAQMAQPGSTTEEKNKKAESAPARTAVSKPDLRKAASLPDLSQEYRYVAADLKRIGIIAAVILVIMVVLAIFLV